MKLIVAIIETDHVHKVIEGLNRENIRATKLSSTGGFLKSGNTTLLIGSQAQDKDRIVDIIDRNCKSKKVRTEEKGEIQVGGATLFVLDMNKYLRI